MAKNYLLALSVLLTGTSLAMSRDNYFIEARQAGHGPHTLNRKKDGTLEYPVEEPLFLSSIEFYTPTQPQREFIRELFQRAETLTTAQYSEAQQALVGKDSVMFIHNMSTGKSLLATIIEKNGLPETAAIMLNAILKELFIRDDVEEALNTAHRTKNEEMIELIEAKIEQKVSPNLVLSKNILKSAGFWHAAFLVCCGVVGYNDVF